MGMPSGEDAGTACQDAFQVGKAMQAYHTDSAASRKAPAPRTRRPPVREALILEKDAVQERPQHRAGGARKRRIVPDKLSVGVGGGNAQRAEGRRPQGLSWGVRPPAGVRSGSPGK